MLVPGMKITRRKLLIGLGVFAGVLLLVAGGALWFLRDYFFTALLLYAMWGLVKSVLLGLLDRLPGGDPLLDTDDEEEDRAEVRTLDYGGLAPRATDPEFDNPSSEEQA